MRDLLRLSAALFISLLLGAPPASLSEVVPFEDPIQGTGHGAAFGVNGQPIDVTADFIAQTQAVYTAHVLENASTSQQVLYELKRAYVDALTSGATLPRDLQLGLFAQSLLLDWLIDQVAPADAARLKSRNGMLIAWLRRGLGYMDEGETFTLLPSEEALFVQIGVLPAAAAAGPSDKVLQARETYAKQCRKAGVPIPPTWGKTGAGFWNSNGVLGEQPDGSLSGAPFISPDKKAEVFVFQSATPKGVCLALPRYAEGADTPIELLGIICMGESKACFWDNQLNGESVEIPRVGEFPLNTNFAAGEELEAGALKGPGICTACHAGENAYIVHPDDAAFQGIANLKPTEYYKPMVAPSWPQNLKPNTKLAGVPLDKNKGDESCLDCHSAGKKQRLPEIVKGLAPYCDAVLTNALKKTMPPEGPLQEDPADPTKTTGPYKKHIDSLMQACADAKK
jgi:hypothetical protein